MKSNYRKIGDFIELVDQRNKDLEIKLLLGLSISKEFIPSVANTIGANMANYKIIRKGQFACSIMQVRRDKKMPIALLQDYEVAIISQAYPVFRIKDESELLPEYLMMWFSRSEFDREACFHAVGGVRGSLEWEDFLNMELPTPSIEKQKAIVKEYNTVVNRIKLNEQLNQKLEETAQALYKHWFVDFEFPNENGQPYKSSGGELSLESSSGEVLPVGWEYGVLDDLTTQFSGVSFKGELYSYKNGISVVRGENVTEQALRWDTHKKWNLELNSKMENSFLEECDIVIGMDGSKVGKNWALISKFDLPLLLAQRVTSVRCKEVQNSYFLYVSMMVNEFQRYVSQIQTGTSVPHISGQQIKDFPLLIPDKHILVHFNKLMKFLFDKIFLNIETNKKLKVLQTIALSNLSK